MVRQKFPDVFGQVAVATVAEGKAVATVAGYTLAQAGNSKLVLVTEFGSLARRKLGRTLWLKSRDLLNKT